MPVNPVSALLQKPDTAPGLPQKRQSRVAVPAPRVGQSERGKGHTAAVADANLAPVALKLLRWGIRASTACRRAAAAAAAPPVPSLAEAAPSSGDGASSAAGGDRASGDVYAAFVVGAGTAMSTWQQPGPLYLGPEFTTSRAIMHACAHACM